MPTSLTNAQTSKTLTDGEPQRQLASWQAVDERWRLLMVTADHPIALELSWTTAQVDGNSVIVSVARSVRLCIYAKSLTIKATNLYSGNATIQVVAVDAYERTQNVLQVDGTGTGAVQVATVPACAQDLRLELEDATLLESSTVRLKDGEGDVISSYPGIMQPEAGIRLGASDSVEVVVPSGCRWRLVFGLTM